VVTFKEIMEQVLNYRYWQEQKWGEGNMKGINEFKIAENFKI